jgi:type I restriction enzyme S subunit
MNADRLLALFERISEAPDPIHRLRRFILDLAVRGKLVEQDPEDEPAEVLLKQIALQRKILIADGQLRKERNEPTIPESTPYALPPGWRWIPFGVMHWLTRGVTYTKSDVSELPEDGYVPLLRANNIGEKLSLDDPVYVRSSCVGGEQYLRSGDFLIALSSGSKHLVGKAVLVPEISAFAFGGFCGVIRIFEEECTGFTKAFLKSSLYRDSVASGSRGIGINNLKKEVLANAFFPFPPLAEQHRIVAKVDELMALCDQLEAALQQREQCRERLVAANLQRLNQPNGDPEVFRSDARFALQVLPSLTTTPAQIKQLRQTILNLAVRGKLVEQDPEDEPADVRLVQIQRALSSTIASMGLRLKRSSSSPAASPEGDFAGVPSSWGLSTLGSLAIVLDPNPSHRYPSYDGGTVPILSTQEFSGLDGWNPSTAKLVPHSFFEYQQANCRFEQGDIVFARKGRLGLPRFLPDFEQFTFSHTVFLVKPMPGISPEYLLWLLRRDQVITWLTNEMNANTGVPTLGKEKMERLPIPLPSLAEQHRIVARVEQLMTLCDQLEQQLSQAEQSRRGLLEAVLREALVGRLPERTEERHAAIA